MIKGCGRSVKSPIKLDFLPDEEREEFAMLGNLKSGKYFAVEAGWFELWIGFLQGGRFPGVIRTQGLVTGAEIKPGLRYSKDYKVLNLQQWIFLYSKYGAEPPIELTSPFEVNIVQNSSSIAHYLNTPPTERMALDTIASFSSFTQTENTADIDPGMNSVSLQSSVGFILGVKGFDLHYCILNTLVYHKDFQVLVNLHRNKGVIKNLSRVCEKMGKEKYCMVKSESLAEFCKGRIGGWFECWENIIDGLDFDSETRDFSQLTKVCVENRIRCENCGKNRIETLEHRSVLVDVYKTLQDGIKAFEEKKRSTEMCEKCGIRMVEHREIVETSDVVFFKVNRFREIPYPYKVFGKIKYRKNMQVCGKEYTLAGVVCHEGGVSDECYWAVCKRGKGWYCYEVDKMSRVNLVEALNKIAVILIYFRI